MVLLPGSARLRWRKRWPLLGKVEEAERLALELDGTSRPDDVHSGVTLAMTWAAVRPAEGRDGEAEGLYPLGSRQRERVGYAIMELSSIRGATRPRSTASEIASDDASRVARLASPELVPAAPSSTERIA